MLIYQLNNQRVRTMPITKSHVSSELKLLHDSLLNDDPALYIELLETKPSTFATKNNTNPFALVIEKNKENILNALLTHPLRDTLFNQFDFSDKPFMHALIYCDYATVSMISKHISATALLKIKEAATQKILKQKVCILMAHADMPLLINEANKNTDIHAIRENLIPLAITSGDFTLFNKLIANKDALKITLNKFDIESYYNNPPKINSLFDKAAFNKADEIINNENKALEKPIVVNSHQFNVFYITNTLIKHANHIYDIASIESMKQSLSLILRIRGKNSLTTQLSSVFKTVYFVAKETNTFNSKLFNKDEINTLDALLGDDSIAIVHTLFSFEFIEPFLLDCIAPHSTCSSAFSTYCKALLVLALSDIDSLDPVNNLLSDLTNLKTYSSKTKQMMLILSIFNHGLEATISHIDHVSLVRELFKLGYEPFDVMLHAKNNRITQEATKNLI